MPITKYAPNCYKLLKSLAENNRYTWATSIKNLLFRYGFGLVWISQEVGDDKYFLSIFKQRVIDCKTQDRHNDIHESSRCDTFKQFKSLLEPENYLMLDISFKQRKA